MKFIFSTLLFLFLLSTVKGQSSEQSHYRKNSIFLELGGVSPFYSVNLDHIFIKKEKLMYSYRIGIGVLPKSFSIPLGLNLITGKSNHHAEFSLAGSFYVQEPFSTFSKEEHTDKMMFLSLGGGYRYQKPSGGLFFTIGLSPLLRLDPPSDDVWNISTKFYPSGHIGIGFRM